MWFFWVMSLSEQKPAYGILRSSPVVLQTHAEISSHVRFLQVPQHHRRIGTDRVTRHGPLQCGWQLLPWIGVICRDHGSGHRRHFREQILCRYRRPLDGRRCWSRSWWLGCGCWTKRLRGYWSSGRRRTSIVTWQTARGNGDTEIAVNGVEALETSRGVEVNIRVWMDLLRRTNISLNGPAVTQLVEALRHKPKGRGLDSR